MENFQFIGARRIGKYKKEGRCSVVYTFENEAMLLNAMKGCYLGDTFVRPELWVSSFEQDFKMVHAFCEYCRDRSHASSWRKCQKKKKKISFCRYCGDDASGHRSKSCDEYVKCKRNYMYVRRKELLDQMCKRNGVTIQDLNGVEKIEHPVDWSYFEYGKKIINVMAGVIVNSTVSACIGNENPSYDVIVENITNSAIDMLVNSFKESFIQENTVEEKNNVEEEEDYSVVMKPYKIWDGKKAEYYLDEEEEELTVIANGEETKKSLWERKRPVGPIDFSEDSSKRTKTNSLDTMRDLNDIFSDEKLKNINMHFQDNQEMDLEYKTTPETSNDESMEDLRSEYEVYIGNMERLHLYGLH